MHTKKLYQKVCSLIPGYTLHAMVIWRMNPLTPAWFQLCKNEHLTVLDFIKAQLPNAEFAFLSACHSAAGDIHGTPDESIHLTAALQFCRFKRRSLCLATYSM
jgi:hypothetical protein